MSIKSVAKSVRNFIHNENDDPVAQGDGDPGSTSVREAEECETGLCARSSSREWKPFEQEAFGYNEDEFGVLSPEVAKLYELLLETSRVHHDFEAKNGKDKDWALWYAKCMVSGQGTARVESVR